MEIKVFSCWKNCWYSWKFWWRGYLVEANLIIH